MANKPKITAKERGFEKTKAGRKEMKANDIMINTIGKASRKEGKEGIADAPNSVSVRPAGPKVPVKGSQKDHHTTSAASFIKTVAGAVIKTPEVKVDSTKEKNPGNPKTSLKNK